MKLPYEKEPVKILKKTPAKITKSTRKGTTGFGIINLDKPSGPTSTETCNQIQDIFGVRKVGYAGTLDPKVTGVLPIGLGKATRLLKPISDAGKVYTGVMWLHKEIPKKNVEAVFKKFTGKIKQKPPVRSAVKRVEREREVYEFKLTALKDKRAEFEVSCAAGTYIRKLVSDLGDTLGSGAHMIRLIRTRAGPFKLKESITLEQLKKLKEKAILPAETAVEHLPKIWIHPEAETSFKNGATIYVPGILQLTSNVKKGDTIAVFNQKTEIIGLAIAQETSKQIMAQKRGEVLRPDVVLL